MHGKVFTVYKADQRNPYKGAKESPEMFPEIEQGLFVEYVFCGAVTASESLFHAVNGLPGKCRINYDLSIFSYRLPSLLPATRFAIIRNNTWVNPASTRR